MSNGVFTNSELVTPKTFLAACAVGWAFACTGCRDIGVGPVQPHTPDMKGFCYTSFTSNGFELGGQSNAVGDLHGQTGNTWIALVVFEYQSTSTSSDIGANTTGRNPLTGGVWSTTSTEADVREGIRQARLQQMHVMLKPHLDLYSGEWRAMVRPDTQGNWFRSYTAMILRYARLASELNVELLCIGTEFVVATQPAYTQSWLALADSVRRYYGGRLTYAANWNGASAAGITQPEFEQVEFWDRLDYIGIDAYYPLTNSIGDPVPRLETAKSRMQTPMQEIGAVASRWRKPVVVTEVGIQSVRGALASPWDFSLGKAAGAVPDNSVQELYYRAIVETIGDQSWCAGIFWWNWDSVPSSYEATDYTPRRKPAARILQEWYGAASLLVMR